MTAPSTHSQTVDLMLPEAWAGELRVNLIRALAIVIFYARHLIGRARFVGVGTRFLRP